MPSIEFIIGPVVKRGRVDQTRRIPHNMSNQRMHWAERRRWNQLWQDVLGWKIQANRSKFPILPLKFATIKILFKMVRPYDRDGAYNASKPLIDALKVNKGYVKLGRKMTVPVLGAGVIQDDSAKYCDIEVWTEKVDKYSLERTI